LGRSKRFARAIGRSLKQAPSPVANYACKKTLLRTATAALEIGFLADGADLPLTPAARIGACRAAPDSTPAPFGFEADLLACRHMDLLLGPSAWAKSTCG